MLNADIWVITIGPKSWGKLVTLFGSYCDDGVSAGTWVKQCFDNIQTLRQQGSEKMLNI